MLCYRVMRHTLHCESVEYSPWHTISVDDVGLFGILNMATLLSCQDCLCFVRVINKNLFSFSLYTLNVGAIYVQAVTLKMSPKKLKRKHKLSLTNKYKSKRRKDSDHQSSDSETTQCSNNTDSKDTDSKDLFDEVHYFSVKKKKHQI